MLITPRPGVGREHLLGILRSLQGKAFNLRGGGGPAQNAQERVLAYLDWANEAVRLLGTQIRPSDLNYLVLTDQYKLLLSIVGTLTGLDSPTQRVVNGLFQQEMEDRATAFEEAITALDRQIKGLSGTDRYVLPDTSFYIHHKEKLEDIDLVPLTGAKHADFVVLVPMVIVDELDRLKESKDKQARWRAGYTLAVLDRLFENGAGRARLQKGGQVPGPDGLTPPKVGIELLFDPPGHGRLPNSDDEIIDQALGVEPLAARKVTLLTYDTGQSTRARNAGLEVVKLRTEIGDEPT